MTGNDDTVGTWKEVVVADRELRLHTQKFLEAVGKATESHGQGRTAGFRDEMKLE